MKELNKNNIESELKGKTALIDFWAVWCGPCQMVAKEIEEIDSEKAVEVYKCNVDEELEIATKFNIEVIPTFVLVKDGKEEKRTSGYMKKDEIKEFFGL